MLRQLITRRAALLAGAVLPLSRLAATDFPAYPVRPSASYARNAIVEGISVGIVPLDHAESQKEYFRVDFSRRGFLPVFVVIESKAAEDVVFRRDEVAILTPGKEGGTEKNIVSGRSKAGEGLMIASAAALSLAGEFIAMHMMVKATEIRQNIIRRELRSTTIPPNTAVHGFIYLSREILVEDTANEARLRIRFHKSTDPQDFEVKIPLDRSKS